MIVVTGGAGFIGSNVVAGLNARGRDDVVVVDDMTDGRKFTNLVDRTIADYLDADRFWTRLEAGSAFVAPPEAVLHLGACTDTTEWDGRYMLESNYTRSRALLAYCLAAGVPLVYASSAAVYGTGREFREAPECERPVNVYGYSKLQFDRHVRRVLARADHPVVGLRYFNVYGPGEAHKGSMASVAWHLVEQARDGGPLRLFSGSDGYGDGEQRRDFVYVGDVVDATLWCLDHADRSGIFNVGTGESASFNDLARAVLERIGGGEIEYVPFPQHLSGHYQSFTCADMTALRENGYGAPFRSVADGIAEYARALGDPG